MQMAIRSRRNQQVTVHTAANVNLAQSAVDDLVEVLGVVLIIALVAPIALLFLLAITPFYAVAYGLEYYDERKKKI